MKPDTNAEKIRRLASLAKSLGWTFKKGRVIEYDNGEFQKWGCILGGIGFAVMGGVIHDDGYLTWSNLKRAAQEEFGVAAASEMENGFEGWRRYDSDTSSECYKAGAAVARKYLKKRRVNKTTSN